MQMNTVNSKKRFFKDPINGKVAGVCSGLAKYASINPWMVRIVAIAVFLIFPFATALGYVLAILLLKDRYSY